MKYYRISQIAKKLGVDRKMVYYWKDQGLFQVEFQLGLIVVSEKEFKKLRSLVRATHDNQPA